MAEYVYPLDQAVAAGQNVLLQDSIPCTKGYVIHRNTSGAPITVANANLVVNRAA